MDAASRSLRGGEIAEIVAGSFVGILAGNLAYAVPVGRTVRQRVALAGIGSVLVGALAGWAISHARRPLGAGLAAGLGGMGAIGLLALLILPAAALDMPTAAFEQPSGLSGLVAGRNLRRSRLSGCPSCAALP